MHKTAAVSLLALTSTLASALTLAGCGQPEHYYLVLDTATQQKYITTDVHDVSHGSGIRFHDDLSGDTVKVEAFEIQTISRDTYEHAKKSGVAPAPPAEPGVPVVPVAPAAPGTPVVPIAPGAPVAQ